MDRAIEEKWFALSVKEQMANIGSEVLRAVEWKKKGNEKRMMSFYEKALDFFILSIRDPKNWGCLNELKLCTEELNDYFIGKNLYDTSAEVLEKYYNLFL